MFKEIILSDRKKVCGVVNENIRFKLPLTQTSGLEIFYLSVWFRRCR